MGVFKADRIEAWLHRIRWARRNIRQMLSADGVIVSHTKSGRTWLRVMMSHAYHLEYGIPANEIIKFDNLHRLNSAIPRLFFLRDTMIPTFTIRGRSVAIPDDKKTLFIIRDPRDVAVSFFFHVRNRASARELDRKGISSADRALELYDFIASEKLGVSRVIEHMNRWYDVMQHMQHTKIIKYERMRTDPEQVLDQVMTFLDRKFDPETITKAVEFASFENLSRKEADGFFNTDKLRPTDKTDGDTYKVRRGKIGGYRDYFDDEQNAYLDTLVSERLNPAYGYS